MTAATFTSWDEWVGTIPPEMAPANYPDPRRYEWIILAAPDARLLGMKLTELEALDFAETVNQSQQLVGETAVVVYKGFPGMVLP